MPNTQLTEALTSAELLLNYSSRNGVAQIDDQIYRAIADTRAAFDAGTVTPSVEARFWKIYRDMSKAVAPVTVASLKDSYFEFGPERRLYWKWGPLVRIPYANRAVFRYMISAFSTLAILLITQAYVLFGTLLLNQLNAVAKPTTASASAGTSTTTSAFASDKDKALRLASQYELLNRWARLHFGGVSDDKHLTDGLGPPQGGTQEIDRGSRERIQLVTSSEFVIGLLQKYLLPLLYGCLGSFTYVLRQLIEQTRNRTFRRESQSALKLRILLGVISGLAIGWFYGAKADGSVSEIIAPLAVSFLAGYSVEVLFALMDAFVQTFGAESRSRNA